MKTEGRLQSARAHGALSDKVVSAQRPQRSPLLWPALSSVEGLDYSFISDPNWQSNLRLLELRRDSFHPT